jgi:uncharacterized membrane protein YphA (DoxX/SURF4 family)
MVASSFILGAVNTLRNSEQAAQRAKPVADQITTLAHRVAPSVKLPSDPKTMVRINAGLQIGASLGLATGRAPRLSALLLASSLVPTTAAGHRFWEEPDPVARSNQRTHFFKNISMLGGLLLGAVDTEGKPGLAWRAKHAADDARRETKHLRKAARREAKLAAKSVKR